jgi:hypothetical protein
MRKKIILAGVATLLIGILLLFANRGTSQHVFQDVVDDANPENIQETIGVIFGGAVFASNVYKIINAISFLLILIALLVICIGVILHEKEKKKITNEGKKSRKGNITYARSKKRTKSKKDLLSKIKSFFNTGWGQKRKKSTPVKLKRTKKRKKYQLWSRKDV